MNTLLTASGNEGFGRAVAALVDPSRHRVLDAGGHAGYTAPPLAVLAEIELKDSEALSKIEALLASHKGRPLIVYTGVIRREIEERAYLAGVAYILPKPVRGPILREILNRLETASSADPPPATAPAEPRPLTAIAAPAASAPATPAAVESAPVFREFANILTSQDSDVHLLERFLRMLHERLEVNRAALYMLPDDARAGDAGPDLRATAAIGVDGDALRSRILPGGDGIAAIMRGNGKILRRGSYPGWEDASVRRDFDALRIDAAIPVVENGRFAGVLALDGTITGGELDNSALSRIYHLLQGLGMAIHRNRSATRSALQVDQLKQVLNTLACGYLVYDPPRRIREIDATARTFLGLPGAGFPEVSLDDLPPKLASRIFEAACRGARESFAYSPEPDAETLFRVHCSPMGGGEGEPPATLVLIDDISELERSKSLEMKAANLELVQRMAEQFSHEIGNALAPISAHQQLLATNHADPSFRNSLLKTMDSGVKRITRLSRQMLYLSREQPVGKERIPLSTAIYDAYRDARNIFDSDVATMDFAGDNDIVLVGDPQAIRHAFSEILLNGLQAGGGIPKLVVRAAMEGRDEGQGKGTGMARITVTDSGGGFPPEIRSEAEKPFFTTRNVGIGLGLTVAANVVRAHGGTLMIGASTQNPGSGVALRLPADVATPTGTPKPATRPKAVFAQAVQTRNGREGNTIKAKAE